MSTPLVEPKSITRNPDPLESVKDPRVSVTAPESCNLVSGAPPREIEAPLLIRSAADPLSNSVPQLILTPLVAVRAPAAPLISSVPALSVVAPL